MNKTMNDNFQKSVTSSNENGSEEVNLSSLLQLLLRGWKVILFFALLGLSLALLYSRYLPPIFQSEALIKINDNPQRVSGLGENISNLIEVEDSQSQAEAELIKSRMVLDPVVTLLNLQIRLTDPSVSIIDRVTKNYIDTQLNTTDSVTLETDTGEAAISQFDVAADYLDQTFTLVKSGSGFLLKNDQDEFEGQFNQLQEFSGVNGDIQINVISLPSAQQPINISKQSIQHATNAISSYLTVTEKGEMSSIIRLSLTGFNQLQTTAILNEIVISYVDLTESRGSEEIIKTVSFMETQIPALKQKLEASEGQFNEFRQRYGTIDVDREAELLLAENAQIDTQLNELMLSRAELTTYYTDEHPTVIQINDQLRVLNARKRSIDNTVTGLPEIQREFLQLSEDVAINREIYLTMLKNYEQLKIVEAGQIGYASIIDLPVNSYATVAPNKSLISLLGLILGTLVGAVIVLSNNTSKGLIKDPNSLEDKLKIPVLAVIPRSKPIKRLTKNRKLNDRLLAYTDRNSLSYEAIKSLRTYLVFGTAGREKFNAVGADSARGRVILVSGERPNVGKSFVCANLAEAFAHLDKKILIVDADLRVGNLHTVFGVEQSVGLVDYFTQETDSISSITHHNVINNIDFISRGRNTPHPSSLITNDRCGELMAELAVNYDYIFIDSPPVLAASDAVILSTYADTVLMVTRYADSLEDQLAYAIKQMNKVNTEVDGIVINDMEQEKMDKRSYYHSFAYGNNQ